MTRQVRILTTAGAIVAGGVVFAIAAGVTPLSVGPQNAPTRPAKETSASRPADDARARRWLGSTEADPEYRAQVRQLTEDLRRQRRELARLIEQVDVSDSLVKEQSEKVLAAQNALERRVVDHMLKIRGTLGPDRRAVLARMLGRQLGDRRTPESGPASGTGPRRERDRDHERDRRNRPDSGPATSRPGQP
ncbi:MAG: hypothetical protein NTV86_07485 [Planctomycetota bacterium]|nr:hypothetical protein [Planctomycetota bacterium]